MIENVAVHAATAVEAAHLHRTTQELAQVDALTRLFNRRRLDDDLQLECERAERYGRPLAVVMLDLDHFKQLNDTVGHQRGDEALQELGVVLTDGIRGSATAYRYGGEEFLLLLRETTTPGASELAERLRARIERRFAALTLPVTASMGVASTENGAVRPADLLFEADRALYRAKQEGRNKVVSADGGAARAPAR
jgi:diguanylate cyclase (GGDEF)-like protein